MKRLLVLACTSRKRPDVGLLPAIQRYDGPSFRVLRKYRRSVADESLKVVILSAEFGLIRDDELIPDYDRFMSRERALQLRPGVMDRLGEFVSEITPTTMLISAGKTYMKALPDLETASLHGMAVNVADGSIGKKLSKLRDWLYGDA